ncbi:3' exoribonuclease family [Aphelenchoides avenae]|nr:3' exoribonuclease family [Aphelenchus avenae]
MVQRENADETFHTVEDFRVALSNFTPPAAEAEEKHEGFTVSSDPLVDEFFRFIGATGRPSLPWETFKDAFLWKIKTVMDDMHIKEAEDLDDGGKKEELINNEEIRNSKQFIMQKAQEFEGIPFTIQRLCELLTTPTKHYRSTEKYLRALEKTINIVTTVTENGERITGTDDFPDEDEPPMPVERNFIIRVDEVDEPLPSIAHIRDPIPAQNSEQAATDGSSDMCFL